MCLQSGHWFLASCIWSSSIITYSFQYTSLNVSSSFSKHVASETSSSSKASESNFKFGYKNLKKMLFFNIEKIYDDKKFIYIITIWNFNLMICL